MPPEFRARIDDDLDQGLQAYMDKEGISQRSDAGRKLMELGLQSAGVQTGEQLSMERTLGHLDRAATVFTVPMQLSDPVTNPETIALPSREKLEDPEQPRRIELRSTMRPISGFILLGMLYEPVSVSGKLTIQRLNLLSDCNLLPYEGEHDLDNWRWGIMPMCSLNGIMMEGPDDMNRPQLRRLSLVGPHSRVEAVVLYHGEDHVVFRLYLLVAPLSAWRSYAWGLKHEADRIVEQERILEAQMHRVEQHYDGKPRVGPWEGMALDAAVIAKVR